jgi:hypothetical protein
MCPGPLLMRFVSVVNRYWAFFTSSMTRAWE